MALVKILASEADLSVRTAVGDPEAEPTPTDDVFTHIGGVTEISISPQRGTADTRDFDSGYWLEHLVVNRGANWTVNGQRLEDRDTGDRDEGQAAVETYAWEAGADAVATFQYILPGGQVYQFDGSVELTPFGGGTDDIMDWSFTLEMTGPLTLIEAPEAE